MSSYHLCYFRILYQYKFKYEFSSLAFFSDDSGEQKRTEENTSGQRRLEKVACSSLFLVTIQKGLASHFSLVRVLELFKPRAQAHSQGSIAD